VKLLRCRPCPCCVGSASE